MWHTSSLDLDGKMRYILGLQERHDVLDHDCGTLPVLSKNRPTLAKQRARLQQTANSDGNGIVATVATDQAGFPILDMTVSCRL
eukprot:CAMPEP_0172812780 /NCGR_PEP_ID=MMETSP1075-20121228/10247_1 /TAXON_ID=2916 /ORGANISM="Ceratium fusus, Strain PA161109" /LENGTH=83 /DNA_ID=CAMNT_0013652373 /DNA_START=26 /DNA_END=274 /DNA_ORIENTATION=+